MGPPRKFSYYRKLSARQKRIYDASDRAALPPIPHPGRFRIPVEGLAAALAADDRPVAEEMARRIVHGLCVVYEVPEVSVRVLAVRPSRRWGELHGLYESATGKRPVVTVWMRTAKLKHVVAFRTFLRTILHEVVHHLDYAFLKLPDSFHTEGFYRRESSLMKSLEGVLPQRTPNGEGIIVARASS